MYERSQVLTRNLASVTGERKKRRAQALKTDRTLQRLVADLVAARTAAGMTQEAVAARMWTTKSVVSRLESGVCTRPTLSTIE
jgi:ribosome-binding protein aMBF1 (putative translation factor)